MYSNFVRSFCSSSALYCSGTLICYHHIYWQIVIVYLESRERDRDRERMMKKITIQLMIGHEIPVSMCKSWQCVTVCSSQSTVSSIVFGSAPNSRSIICCRFLQILYEFTWTHFNCFYSFEDWNHINYSYNKIVDSLFFR